MSAKREFTIDEAKAVGDRLGADWSAIDSEQFRIGLSIELEHAGVDARAALADGDLVLAGKAALSHLDEFPDYYTRTRHLEEETEEFWEEGRT